MANKKLSAWFEENKNTQFSNKVILSEDCQLTSPSIGFNLVYQLVHIYRHLLNEGIGLRQLMDYYFLMKHAFGSEDFSQAANLRVHARNVIDELGLSKFASAIMWVLQRVFGLNIHGMAWLPNQRDGEFLLQEILLMGNFGHQNDRYHLDADDLHMKRFLQMVYSKWRFIGHFPNEVFWLPIDIISRFFEIRRMRRLLREVN